jgi:MerR family copper efflux transcriptional regulator
MLIGDLARRTGASQRSLRHYERVGLLDPARAANGYRHYDQDAVERVRHIRELLANGFTTQDIAVIAPCLGRPPEPDCEPGLALYRDKLAEIEDRIEGLRALRDDLRRRLAEIEAGGRAPGSDRPDPQLAVTSTAG